MERLGLSGPGGSGAGPALLAGVPPLGAGPAPSCEGGPGRRPVMRLQERPLWAVSASSVNTAEAQKPPGQNRMKPVSPKRNQGAARQECMLDRNSQSQARQPVPSTDRAVARGAACGWQGECTGCGAPPQRRLAMLASKRGPQLEGGAAFLGACSCCAARSRRLAPCLGYCYLQEWGNRSTSSRGRR